MPARLFLFAACADRVLAGLCPLAMWLTVCVQHHCVWDTVGGAGGQARSGVCFGHSATDGYHIIAPHIALQGFRQTGCAVSSRLMPMPMLMLESGTKGSHLLHRAKMSFVVVQWLAYQAKRLVSVKPPDGNAGQCRITCPTAAAPPQALALLIRGILQLCSYQGRYVGDLEVLDKWQSALGTWLSRKSHIHMKRNEVARAR